MKALAACGEHVRIADLDQFLLEADERVWRAAEQTAERVDLHVALLQRAVGEKALHHLDRGPSGPQRV
jgi:hypothetical protein